VREQARRISRCRLTFVRRTGGVEAVTHAAFVREAILPTLDSTRAEGQLSLWQERATLDEGFYASLIEHPLPLREAAIREISGRSMAIDVYIWLAYRLHALSKATPISWTAVYCQFGAGYRQDRLRDLKPVFTDALKLALAVYPEAQVEVDEGIGLVLLPSPPPMAERHRRIA